MTSLLGLLLLFYRIVDGQSFTNPTFGSNVNIYGNLSGSVDFSFTYTVPDNNKVGALSCGYGARNYIAQKRGTQPATIQGGFVGRAEIITDITGSSLTIRLKNLNFNDAKPVSCLLVYDGLPYDSGRYDLNIYERPRFIDCLNAGIVNRNLRDEFTLNEGQTLNSTCINYGNPVPFLQCSVLNKDGFVDNGAMTSSERKNYTTRPISQRLLFYNVRRTATKVRCVADGGSYTGKATIEKNVVVNYKPDATTFSSFPSSKPIHGTSLTLNCSSNGRPAPSYRIQSITGRNNVVLLSNSTSGTHIISKINYADYVDYKVTFRCVPHNFIGSGPLKDINLEVQAQPILLISSNQTVEEGQNIILSCNITAANPPANITWKNPSGSTVGHTNGVITLNSIKRQQAGSYSCQADNGVVGAVTKNTQVIVQPTKLSTPRKTTSNFKSATYGLIALSIISITVIVALVLLVFKMRKEIANLKVENEALRGAKTDSNYMELMQRSRDDAGQEYEKLRHTGASSSNSNHGTVNTAYAEIISKDSHGVEQPYMEISKPYEVINSSM